MKSTKLNSCREKMIRSAAIILTSATVFSGIAIKTSAKTVSYEYEITFKTPIKATVDPGDYALKPTDDGKTAITFSESKQAEFDKMVAKRSQVAFDAFISDDPARTMWMDSPDSLFSITAYLTAEQQGGDVTIEAQIKGIIDVLKQNSAYTDPKGMYDFLCSEVSKFTSSGSTVYEKVKYIHDYVCNLNKYDKKSPHPHSAYGALIDHRSVCEGYAEAFKLLCDKCGIPCILVSGKTTEAHMWNYVKMDDGKWYAVDTTWDDDDKTGKIKTTYFLVGSKNAKYSKDHHANGDISGTKLKTFEYPTLSGSDYVDKSGKTSSGNTSRFFYDQLDDEQKHIYDQLMKFPLPKGKTPVVTTTAKIETAPETTKAAITTKADITSKAASTTEGKTTVSNTVAPADTVPDVTSTDAEQTASLPDASETASENTDRQSSDTEDGSSQSITVLTPVTLSDTNGDEDGDVTSDISGDTMPDTDASDGDSGINLPVVIGIGAAAVALIAIVLIISVKSKKKQ